MKILIAVFAESRVDRPLARTLPERVPAGVQEVPCYGVTTESTCTKSWDRTPSLSCLGDKVPERYPVVVHLFFETCSWRESAHLCTYMEEKFLRGFARLTEEVA